MTRGIRSGGIVAVGLLLSQAVSASPPPLPDDAAVARVVLEAEGRKQLPPELLLMAGAAGAELRARAALALGRIGLPGGAEPLLELMRDPASQVRAMAAFALGKLELDLRPDPGSVPAERVRDAVASALADPDPSVVGAALWSLGFLDGGRAAVADWLAAADPEDADERALELALGSWWRLGGSVEATARFLSATSERVRLAAAHALRRLDDPAGMPQLARLLDDPSPEVRLMALRGLGDAPATVINGRAPALLRDLDWRVQCQAAAWLGGLWGREGESSPEDALVAEVLRRSLDRNLHVRRCALEALGGIVDRRAVATDRLLRAVTEDEAAVRATALRALTGGSPAVRARAWEAVTGAGGPADAAAWIQDLATEPTTAEPLLELAAGVDSAPDGLLAAAVRDGAPTISGAALRLLASSRPERAAELADELLDRADPDAVARGATTLGSLFARGAIQPDPERVERLWRRFYDGRGTDLEPARGPLLGALLQADPELMARRASLLIGEPDRVLRLRAFRALADRPAFAEALADSTAPFRGHGPAAAIDWASLAERVVALQRSPVRVRLESARGSALLELRADWAPRTVDQLVGLIDGGAYDRTRFYRVIPGFVAQGGPVADAGATAVPGEDSLLRYDTGTVGLALAGRDTGSTEIYVTHAAQPHLEGLYPVLGRVVDGQRTIDRIQPGDVASLRLEAPGTAGHGR